jgi:hypothetical protein
MNLALVTIQNIVTISLFRFWWKSENLCQFVQFKVLTALTMKSTTAGIVTPCGQVKLTVASEHMPAHAALCWVDDLVTSVLNMAAVLSSETSVEFYQTIRHISQNMVLSNVDLSLSFVLIALYE